MAQADPGEVPEVEDVEQNVDVVEKIYGIFQVTQRRSLRTYLNSYQRLNSPEALTLRTTLLNDNPQPEIVTDDIVEVQGPEPKIIADYIVKVQEQVEKLIQAHQNAVDQNRGPPKTLRELRDNCLFFKQLTGHLRYEQALRNTNDPAFISKQNFRSLHSIESEDLVDACHIIQEDLVKTGVTETSVTLIIFMPFLELLTAQVNRLSMLFGYVYGAIKSRSTMIWTTHLTLQRWNMYSN